MPDTLVRAMNRSLMLNQTNKIFDFTDQIVVIVGAAENPFMVHTDVLTHRSPFFQDACDQVFRQSKNKAIQLPKADPDTFKCYLQWAYSGQVVLRAVPSHDNVSETFACLTRLYLLATDFKDFSLKNTIVDTFLDVLKRFNQSPSTRNIKALWSSTPEGCKLREAVVDWFVFHTRNTRSKWLESNWKRLPEAFFAELGMKFAKANWDKSRVWDPLLPSNRHHYYEPDEEATGADIDDLSDGASQVPD